MLMVEVGLLEETTEFRRVVDWPHFVPVPITGDALEIGQFISRVTSRIIHFDHVEEWWISLDLGMVHDFDDSTAWLRAEGWEEADGAQRQTAQSQ
jgi:hypothetical protein